MKNLYCIHCGSEISYGDNYCCNCQRNQRVKKIKKMKRLKWVKPRVKTRSTNREASPPLKIVNSNEQPAIPVNNHYYTPILNPAPSGHRLLNFIIDLSVFYVLVFFFIGFFGGKGLFNFLFANPIIYYPVILMSLFFLYFIFETLTQKTPGKYLTGTRVIMKNGSTPDAATIAKRSLIRFIPLEVFSIEKNTWWHDRWVDTMVVKNEDLDRFKFGNVVPYGIPVSQS